MNETDRARLRSYLLGALSAPERDQVEDALLDERDDLFEALLEIEEELLESAAEGALSAVDEARFVDYLARLPGGRDDARATQALNVRARGLTRERQNRRWVYRLAAAAILCVGLGSGWVLREAFDPGSSRSVVETVAPQESATPEFVVLVADRTRSEGEIPRISPGAPGSAVELRLDANLDPSSRYHVVIHDVEGNERIAHSRLEVHETPEQYFVSLWIVPDQLPRGDYLILLSREVDGEPREPEARYDLRITSR